MDYAFFVGYFPGDQERYVGKTLDVGFNSGMGFPVSSYFGQVPYVIFSSLSHPQSENDALCLFQRLVELPMGFQWADKPRELHDRDQFLPQYRGI